MGGDSEKCVDLLINKNIRKYISVSSVVGRLRYVDKCVYLLSACKCGGRKACMNDN